MKLAGVIYDVVNAYDGTAIEIYLSGCNRKCFGCHSPELQDYSFGTEIDGVGLRTLISGITENEAFADIISFLGGDPLQQDNERFAQLVGVLQLMFPNKKYWLFTGEDDIETIPKWIWKTFDTVKVGSYKEELRQSGFPASSNQKILRKGVDF